MASLFDSYYYTYILGSQKDGKPYSDYTSNLPSRFEAHQSGEVESAKYSRPVALIYFEACTKKHDALKQEKYFKTHYGKMFLKKCLKPYFAKQAGANK